MARRSKIFIGTLLLMVLLIHLQQYGDRPIIKKLQGAFQKVAFPEFQIDHWLKSDWQSQFENYQNQNFGYRSALTRIHNQLHFTIFQEVFHKDISLGIDGDLIGAEYLEAYTGLRFVGDSTIESRSKGLARLQKFTADSNKLFLVVLAPDKAFSNPERFNLPEKPLFPNNFEVWKNHLEEDSIPLIDFRSHFAKFQAKTPYPLFSKTGIHWSVWGMRYALDSIAGYIAASTNLKMPRMKTMRTDWSTEYRAIEKDLESALNLAWPIPKDSLAYQHFEMQNNGERPRVLVIADSYFYEMYSSGLANKYFEAPFFWYYNYRALKYDWLEAPTNPKHYDMDSLINATDVILLMSAAGNLNDFPWAFDRRIP